MTPAEFEKRKAQIQSQVSHGDIPATVGKRLIEQAWLSTQTVQEREAFKEVVKLDTQLGQQRDALIALAKRGPIYPPAAGASLFKRNQFKLSEQLREIFLTGDWPYIYDRIPHYAWDAVGQTPIDIAKWHFRWVKGKKVYVPFSDASLIALANQAHPKPPMYKPPQSQRDEIAQELIARQKNAANNFPNTDVKHVALKYPTRVRIEEPQPSTWMTIRKPLLISAGIIAAAYLGPIVVDKIAGAYGSSATATGGAASEASAKATFFSKVKAGGNQVLGYVNKARTVEAIAKGEMPPPPIGITGNSFREWAFDVAKKEIQDAAKEKAAEMGMEYIQRELTKKEEDQLRREIAAMQNELTKLIPEDTPMEPSPNLPAPVVGKMIQEKERSQDLSKVLMVAVPVGMAYFLTS